MLLVQMLYMPKTKMINTFFAAKWHVEYIIEYNILTSF